LILKNIITPDDWEELSDHIQFDFLYDNHFSDLKANELLQEQLGVVAAMEPYMGKYFSNHFVRTKVLKQTEDDIKEIRKKYINLSKTYHPDLLINKGVPEEVLEKSKEKMRKINNAWDQIQKLKKTS